MTCMSEPRFFSARATFNLTPTMEGSMVQKAQRTKEGFEIPVPKRGDFLGNLKKAATPENLKQARDMGLVFND